MTNENETDILDKRHTASKTRVSDVLYTLPSHGSHHDISPLFTLTKRLMKNISKFTLFFVLLVQSFTLSAQTTTPRVELRNNDRIVFPPMEDVSACNWIVVLGSSIRI